MKKLLFLVIILASSAIHVNGQDIVARKTPADKKSSTSQVVNSDKKTVTTAKTGKTNPKSTAAKKFTFIVYGYTY